MQLLYVDHVDSDHDDVCLSVCDTVCLRLHSQWYLYRLYEWSIHSHLYKQTLVNSDAIKNLVKCEISLISSKSLLHYHQ